MDLSKIANISKCQPPRWASNGHLQTIFGHYYPCEGIGDGGERIILSLPDGDQLLGFYYPGELNKIIYLFHGLAGDSHSSYMSRIAAIYRKRGFHVFNLNFRGSGMGAGLAKKLYHLDSWTDLETVFAWGFNRFRYFEHTAVGFSLGGAILLNFLAQSSHKHHYPNYAITVNSPLALTNVSQNLRQGWSKLYSKKFVYDVRVYLKALKAAGINEYPMPSLLFDRMEQVDDRITAKIAGYSSGMEYYEKTSPIHFLSGIQVPTILMTSKDDPIIPYQDYHMATLGENMEVHIEPVGGHLGYLNKGATPLGSVHWMDHALMQLTDYIQNKYQPSIVGL